MIIIINELIAAMKKLKKILLIDDDQISNELNKIIITDLQITHQLSIETDGERGLKHLIDSCECKTESSSSCPELVILDHLMPVMDGLEMMQDLKERDFIRAHRIVFILLAVHSTGEHIEEFKKLGVQEYTSKPLSKQRVMDAYRKYFANDTARDHTS